MITETISGARIATQANVYFDGKCVSHSLTLADGTKKSVGVVLPSELTFKTGAAETMECVAGGCEYRLAGSDLLAAQRPGPQVQHSGQFQFRHPRHPGLPLHLPLRLNRRIP